MVERPPEPSPSMLPLGVVLTGGLGTRLRPLTLELPKAMVPLLNRPLIAYTLDLLAGAGIEETVVVVGGDDERTGPAALAAAPPGLRLSVAVQSEPRGSGDALLAVGEALEGRPVVVVAVDTVLAGASLAPHVAAFAAGDEVARVVLHATDRPREMGIVELGSDGERIVHFEEKPAEPRSNLALVGVWMLAPPAVERLRSAPHVNAKGEVDLSGTLAVMVGEGAHLAGSVWEGEWLDGGSLAWLLHAQQRLLALHGAGAPPASVRLVEAELGERVLLGEGAHVERSQLGPDVVLGDGAVIRDARLVRALVAPGAHLEGGVHEGVIVTPGGEIVAVGR
jgi:glucose-1-phosphate thymidylyltransferase